jgi:hypothetical protein
VFFVWFVFIISKVAYTLLHDAGTKVEREAVSVEVGGRWLEVLGARFLLWFAAVYTVMLFVTEKVRIRVISCIFTSCEVYRSLAPFPDTPTESPKGAGISAKELANVLEVLIEIATLPFAQIGRSRRSGIRGARP